jgi:hypothetical protein
LLNALHHGLGRDFVHLVNRVTHDSQNRIGHWRFAARRLGHLAELAPEKPDGLDDSILFGCKMSAMDFRSQEALQIVRQIDRQGVYLLLAFHPSTFLIALQSDVIQSADLR